MSAGRTARRQEKIQVGTPDFGYAQFIAYRLATETFLRGVDLLNEAVGGNIGHGMLLNALWCLKLRETVAPAESQILPAEWNGPMGIHELASALDLPYSTVHRQLGQLMKKGLAARDGGGTTGVSIPFLRSQAGKTFRQRSIASFARLTVSLQRIGYLTGNISALERIDGLSTEQEDVVFRAGLETLLICLLLTKQFYSDLVTGLVFKLVATANVSHLTGSPQAVTQITTNVPDELRRPISIYNAARALHMPYETTRRISRQLLARNAFRQAGDKGLIVPSDVHGQSENADAQLASFRALASGIGQMAYAGLKFRLTAG